MLLLLMLCVQCILKIIDTNQEGLNAKCCDLLYFTYLVERLSARKLFSKILLLSRVNICCSFFRVTHFCSEKQLRNI